MHDLLKDEKLLTALSLFIISLLSFLTSGINRFRDKMKERQESQDALIKDEQEKQAIILKSIKRSALRSEYLSIYNSHKFKPSEKYNMTRHLVKEYYELNGNTYIAELDTRLASQVIMASNNNVNIRKGDE